MLINGLVSQHADERRKTCHIVLKICRNYIISRRFTEFEVGRHGTPNHKSAALDLDLAGDREIYFSAEGKKRSQVAVPHQHHAADGTRQSRRKARSQCVASGGRLNLDENQKAVIH